MATIPKYRKMGLAKAAVYEAVNRCAKLGANTWIDFLTNENVP